MEEESTSRITKNILKMTHFFCYWPLNGDVYLWIRTKEVYVLNDPRIYDEIYMYLVLGKLYILEILYDEQENYKKKVICS